MCVNTPRRGILDTGGGDVYQEIATQILKEENKGEIPLNFSEQYARERVKESPLALLRRDLEKTQPGAPMQDTETEA